MAVREITVDELATALDDGARLVDVREPDEHAGGHVPGAQLMPLATVGEHLDELRTAADEGSLLVICHSGGRSMKACEFLAEHDIEASNVAGGTSGWIASGGAVET
ncbi:MAG: rhodanese-like domain-containing protein [Actinomycetota bacterium]|nr:rhodanese-like domain-containing protein [Actinomycetota bacterium]